MTARPRRIDDRVDAQAVLGLAKPIQQRKAYRLWFAARPVLPPALRPRGKNGKPKPPEPSLPLTINDRTRVHWRTVARLTKYWRGEAKRLAREAGIPACQRIRVTATIHHRVKVRVDESSERERLKALVDGLVDAGVIPDDTRDHLEHGPVYSMFGGARGVVLLIEAATDERGGEV